MVVNVHWPVPWHGNDVIHGTVPESGGGGGGGGESNVHIRECGSMSMYVGVGRV